MPITTTTTTPNPDDTQDAEFRSCDTRELVAQIGRMNIACISGGRIEHRETGITLPVGRGYTVTVDLDWNDTYVVRRVYTRAGRVTVKGQQYTVYCDQVGEVAYQASCFVNGPFGVSV